MTETGTADTARPPTRSTRDNRHHDPARLWSRPSYAARPSTGRARGDGIDLLYSRYGNNPNQRSVAEKVAALEGTEAALAVASGMAAISMTLLAACGAGDHIVASRHLYGATHALLTHELPRRGVATTFVDPGDPSAWQAALTPHTRVVLIELPTNPTLRVFDIGPPARRRGRPARSSQPT